MGRIFVLELEGRSYRCKFCKTHLALFSDCVSRVSFFPCDLVRLFIVAGEKRSSSTMRPLLILDISQTLPSTMTFPIKRQAKIKQKQNGNESTVDTERLACWERRMNPKPHTIGKVNITMGALEERMMLSGVHTVADIFCCFCGQIVGWKYETAHDVAQKYKEGKFVLERGRIIEDVDFSTEFDIDSEDA